MIQVNTHSNIKLQMMFYVVSVVVICLHLATITWHPLPWIDEVMFTDLSVNFVKDGEWTTTAWFGDQNNEAYSVYPPLYQFVLIPWVWLFGVSPLACRSLNVFLAFFVSLIFYRLLKKNAVLENYYSLAAFLALFWCAETFSWIYRNGRPDTLNMLCASAFLYCSYTYLHEAKYKWLLPLFACLTILSGIQACPYLVGILLCLYFFQLDKKKLKIVVFMFFAGLLGGLILLNVYAFLQGHLLSFYYRTFILYSSSVKNVISFLLPYVEQVLPLNAGVREALLKSDASIPFFEKIVNAYLVNKEYLLLCFGDFIVWLWLLFKRKINGSSVETKLMAFTALVPLFMAALAGHFVGYYSWMAYLPAAVCLVYILGKHCKSRCVPIIYGVVILTVVSLGLPKTLVYTDKNAYHNVESFVGKQNFGKDDKIVSPFVSYYAVRNITKKCYFIGVYPLELVPVDARYVLMEKNDFGSEKMDLYINQCVAAGKQVSVLDSLDFPPITLYAVEW
jgi:4-amino-4-deoxy-L-arabinose transferase-like glycosyltransferase